VPPARGRAPDDSKPHLDVKRMSIQISENASKQISKLLKQRGIPNGGLRVAVKAGGCSGLSYVFEWNDDPKDNDNVVEGTEGARIFVDPRSLRFLDGTILDYDTALISKGFVLENPKAKSTCGCGVSFSV
jgi:iron-sulfur cluster assembly protein